MTKVKTDCDNYMTPDQLAHLSIPCDAAYCKLGSRTPCPETCIFYTPKAK